MTALETILKSRRDSVAKIKVQIADLDKAIGDCSLTVKPVYETERNIKVLRLARLEREVGALEAEVERLAPPSLPGMGPQKGPAKR